ncbi:MAG: cytochrome P450, partial [Actinobacteria bacterium]|nr:cytochrome P450 [Actinomycetota bacterium]
VNERRARPGEDLISAMVEVEEEGEELTDFEIVGTSILTLNAGHEATVHAIGNALLALARRPDSYRQLTGGGVDMSTAADEMLRYDSPLQMFERWVLEDTQLDGHRMGKGSKVGLLFGSANRDESAFEEPDEIRLDRSPNPHVAFGAGVHYCVGAPLARVELETALGRFAARVGAIELIDAGDRIESLVFRGMGRIELALEPA